MKFWPVFIAVMMVFAGAAHAQQNYLRIELADNRVDITTGFNGTDVILFGTTHETGGDIIVTLKGPEHTMAVRRKGRVLGAWMNRKTVEFRRVPSYYDYASTLSDDVLESDAPLIKDNQIGVNHLDFYSEDDDDDADTQGTFRDALIRSMQEKGFFPLRGHLLQNIDTQFFKADFKLPPGVPTGLYTVEALLIKDNVVLARETKTLRVGQVGFNARIYIFAQNYSFFYGVFAVVMALVSGWSAFTFLRRD